MKKKTIAACTKFARSKKSYEKRKVTRTKRKRKSAGAERKKKGKKTFRSLGKVA